MKMCNLNYWLLVGSVLSIANLLSDWCVYSSGALRFLPIFLSNGWFVVSIVGTLSGVIILCLDCLYCVDDIVNDNNEQISRSRYVFIATLCEDIPHLILSLVTMKSMTSDGFAGGAISAADLLSAFKVSSLASLVVSVFRLVRVLVLGSPTREPSRSRWFLYSIVSVLSCVVFVKSCNVEHMNAGVSVYL